MKRPRTLLSICLSFLVGVAWLAACNPAPLATQTPAPTVTPTPTLAPTPTVDNHEHLQIFEAVWSKVNETFYDPEFGGVDWAAIHDEYEPLIATAGDDEAFYDLLNRMLWELNVSHVGVGPVDAWPSVEPAVWENGKTGIELRLIDGQAVITGVEAGSPAEKAGLRAGFIIQTIEGKSVEQILAEMEGPLSPPHTESGHIDIQTRQLMSMIYGDPGTCVRLTYLDDLDVLQEGCIERIQRLREGYMGEIVPPDYLEFESRRLGNGIGYIHFNTFHEDLIPDMVAAVNELKNAPGIIIDLRGNPGGDPVTVEQMAGLFLEGQVSFGSFRTRAGSIPRTVDGNNTYSGPLVVLIDELSFSGSEYFSASMQTAGRAVIIGNRSPGGLTAMNVEALPNGALLGYPVAQLVTSDGKVLEGVGVIPDKPVSLTREQLLEGIDAQLQAGIDTIKAAQTIAFTNVNLIPMTSETVIENQTVLVRGSEILAIGDSGKVKIPARTQVIDGKGAYLMPGLADMHAHTRISTGQWAQPWEDPKIWPVHPLNLYIANGVTTIRDLSAMDETGAYPLQLREEIRAGKRVGPTIYTAGEGLYASPLGDPAELVRLNHELGYDLLKLYSYLSLADFQAALREAKKLGTYTTGHIPYAVGLEGVLAEGMDEIAHVIELVWEFAELDRDRQLSPDEWGAYTFQAIQQKVDLDSSAPLAEFEKENQSTLENLANELRTARLAVCTTIDVAETTRMKLFQPEAFLARPENKFLDPKYLEAFRRGKEYQQVVSRGWEKLFALEYDINTWILAGLHEAGVQLLLGTDALGGLGIVPGYSIHDELRILVENGFTPYEALQTGTVNAASVVEKMTGEGNFGTIEIGKRADLILVKGNPLEDITTIKEPLGVMAAGRWFSGEEQSRLIEIPGQ